MSSLQRLDDGVEDLERAIQSQAFPSVLELTELPLEIHTVEQLHDQTRRSTGSPTQIENRYRAGAGER